MNIVDKLRFKLLMMKRVKAFTISLQKGLSIQAARKITDYAYPVSEEYLEYEKGLKKKEKKGGASNVSLSH